MYNTGEYLEECLGSILSQTFSDFEVILVDDGSTDDSLEIARRFSDTDDRIKVFSQPNAGLAAARNLGIEKATGEFLGFIDSDDYVDPTMFSSMLESIDSSGSDICVCQFSQVEEDGRSLSESSFPLEGTVDEYFRLILSSRESSMACNKLFRRSLFEVEDTRFPVGLIHEDVPTIYKLFHHASSVSVLDRPMYFWVRRDGTLSKSMSLKHALDLMWGFELTRRDLDGWGVLEEYREELFHRIAHFSVGAVGRFKYWNESSAGVQLPRLVKQWIDILEFGTQDDLIGLQASDGALHRQYIALFGDVTQKMEKGSSELLLLNERLRATEKRLELIESSTSFRLLQTFTSAVGKLFPSGTRRRDILSTSVRRLVKSSKRVG